VGPRYLYAHGFGSGPGSKKGVAIAAHLAARGVSLERLDLRVPSFERLRFGATVATLRAAIGGPEDRAVVFGSSLGGLAAARAAEQDARIAALVLLAPAFRLAERWRSRLSPEELADWERSGWREVWDHARGVPGRVDHGFLLDIEAHDARGGGWPDVRVPTLIVHGRADTSVDIATSREFARGKRHVRLVEVDDEHELTASLPRICAEVDRFLAPFLGQET
jgi:alpha-beta hydrolase superfamily lysophospholipase